MRHLTVVYTINDEKAFEEEQQRISNLCSPSQGKPFAITAWSLDHEINRTMLIQEALENHDWETAEQLISADGVGKYGNVEEFISANP
ncbi:MAG: hypothetical protein JSR71_09180 [Proteobacteria bacterium]|nr:hypothetical protein [Pseudomonadota bacterium]